MPDEYVSSQSSPAEIRGVQPHHPTGVLDRPPAAPARAAPAYAVVLYLDEFSERRVRQLWDVLDDHGVPSAGSTYEADYRPHITLAIVEAADPMALADRLRAPLAGVAGMPVTMTALGFFLTERAPAYLAVAPTRRLLEVHEEVHRAIGTAGSWTYYRPGTWMPHCTLAMDVECQTSVADALGADTLPIRATVGSAFLTALPTRPATATGTRPGRRGRPADPAGRPALRGSP